MGPDRDGTGPIGIPASPSPPLLVPKRRFRNAVLAALLLWPIAAWLAARVLLLPADCVDSERLVVLAGSQEYRARTHAAAELYAAGAAPRILLTDDGLRGGWSRTEQRNPFFVERAAAALHAYGVPPDSIDILPQRVDGTYAEAEALRRYADEHGLASLLVVSSPYHARRAHWSFRRAFDGSPTTVRVCAIARTERTAAPGSWWLSRGGWREVAGEHVKLLGYRFAHRRNR
jgi:uncharacterized SAM-binding protein YcdF (DUF218 family)